MRPGMRVRILPPKKERITAGLPEGIVLCPATGSVHNTTCQEWKVLVNDKVRELPRTRLIAEEFYQSIRQSVLAEVDELALGYFKGDIYKAYDEALGSLISCLTGHRLAPGGKLSKRQGPTLTSADLILMLQEQSSNRYFTYIRSRMDAVRRQEIQLKAEITRQRKKGLSEKD